jgi:uncharacterized protein YacL
VPGSRARPGRTPGGIVELLRLLAVIFFAGVGYEIGRLFGSNDSVLGPFNGVACGVIVGSGIGYVIGGVLGRTTVLTVDRTEQALRNVSAEQLVAGGLGGVAGVVLGAGIAWPVFLIGEPFIAFPLFAFVIAVLGLLGFRLGQSRRDSTLAIFGARAGLPARDALSALPRVLDTSVAVDGRILAVVRAGFLHGVTLLPAFVIAELQGLADAGDELRRTRGRRGLETLDSLQRETAVDVQVVHDEIPEVPEVDAKLVRLCLDRSAALLTLDTNLAKAAALAGVRVMNLHTLAQAMRPPVVAGDEVAVLLTKAGKEPGQGVGYLDDGTMVVVERARSAVGSEVQVKVSSVLTTANGRIVFAHPVTPVVGAPR